MCLFDFCFVVFCYKWKCATLHVKVNLCLCDSCLPAWRLAVLSQLRRPAGSCDRFLDAVSCQHCLSRNARMTVLPDTLVNADTASKNQPVELALAIVSLVKSQRTFCLLLNSCTHLGQLSLHTRRSHGAPGMSLNHMHFSLGDFLITYILWCLTSQCISRFLNKHILGCKEDMMYFSKINQQSHFT